MSQTKILKGDSRGSECDKNRIAFPVAVPVKPKQLSLAQSHVLLSSVKYFHNYYGLIGFDRVDQNPLQTHAQNIKFIYKSLDKRVLSQLHHFMLSPW